MGARDDHLHAAAEAGLFSHAAKRFGGLLVSLRCSLAIPFNGLFFALLYSMPFSELA